MIPPPFVAAFSRGGVNYISKIPQPLASLQEAKSKKITPSTQKLKVTKNGSLSHTTAGSTCNCSASDPNCNHCQLVQSAKLGLTSSSLQSTTKIAASPIAPTPTAAPTPAPLVASPQLPAPLQLIPNTPAAEIVSNTLKRSPDLGNASAPTSPHAISLAPTTGSVMGSTPTATVNTMAAAALRRCASSVSAGYSSPAAGGNAWACDKKAVLKMLYVPYQPAITTTRGTATAEAARGFAPLSPSPNVILNAAAQQPPSPLLTAAATNPIGSGLSLSPPMHYKQQRKTRNLTTVTNAAGLMAAVTAAASVTATLMHQDPKTPPPTPHTPDSPMSVDSSSDSLSGSSGSSGGSSPTLSPASAAVRFPTNAGACMIAHPEKAAKGGEDAVLLSSTGRAPLVLAVADGVGGWGDFGVDAGLFSRALVGGAEHRLREMFGLPLPGSTATATATARTQPSTEVGPSQLAALPLDLMQFGFDHVRRENVRGSSTACIVVVQDNVLHARNLGDSGFMVIRPSPALGTEPTASLSVVLRSTEQQHQFNFPYQLACAEGEAESPSQADAYSLNVQKGDIIVLGTDGLFDNLHDQTIVRLIRNELLKSHSANSAVPDTKQIAYVLGMEAHRVGKSPREPTPFADNARRHGHYFAGGKLDDITVAVAVV